MSNDSESWKVIALTGTLSVAITSSALAATEVSTLSDPSVRLAAVRDLAQQNGLIVQSGDRKTLVAQGKYTKIDGGEYNKIDSGKRK